MFDYIITTKIFKKNVKDVSQLSIYDVTFLKYISDGNDYHYSEMFNAMAVTFQVTDEDQKFCILDFLLELKKADLQQLVAIVRERVESNG